MDISVLLLDGPTLTDQSGNLSHPIWSCLSGEYRCRHFSIHEGHHFYCAAQPIKGQTYPSPNVGKQLSEPRPDLGCPYRPYFSGGHFTELELED